MPVPVCVVAEAGVVISTSSTVKFPTCSVVKEDWSAAGVSSIGSVKLQLATHAEMLLPLPSSGAGTSP